MFAQITIYWAVIMYFFIRGLGLVFLLATPAMLFTTFLPIVTATLASPTVISGLVPVVPAPNLVGAWDFLYERHLYSKTYCPSK